MKIIVSIYFSLLVGIISSQNVGINSTGAIPNASALLDVDASPTNDKGFLMPRMSTAQRVVIPSPVDGLLVYDTDLGGIYRYSTINNKWDCANNPAGTVDYFANITAPIGYLECNGQAVSRAQYPELYSAIGVLYGAGDGTTTFNLPDLRGEFIRGADNARGVDPSRVLGSVQLDQFQGHHHDFSGNYFLGSGGPIRNAVTQGQNVLNPPFTQTNNDILNPLDDGVNGAPRTGSETRPRNIALMPCIKY